MHFFFFFSSVCDSYTSLIYYNETNELFNEINKDRNEYDGRNFWAILTLY